MAATLTRRQQEMLDFIREQREIGLTPSTREIQHHFGFASQTAAVNHLRALERKGAIQRFSRKARGLVLPGIRRPVIAVPIYGQIAAGLPADAEQQSEGNVTIDAASIGVRKNSRLFALRVRGESMINAHITDGDTVILEHREPRHGDIVAALIDGETTLKRYLVQRGRPYLKAENAGYPDLIPARELVVQGVMVALVRQQERGRSKGVVE